MYILYIRLLIALILQSRFELFSVCPVCTNENRERATTQSSIGNPYNIRRCCTNPCVSKIMLRTWDETIQRNKADMTPTPACHVWYCTKSSYSILLYKFHRKSPSTCSACLEARTHVAYHHRSRQCTNWWCEAVRYERWVEKFDCCYCFVTKTHAKHM